MSGPGLIEACLEVDAAVRALFPKTQHDTPRVTDLRMANATLRKAVLDSRTYDAGGGDPLAILELALANCRDNGVSGDKIVAATTRSMHHRPAPATADAQGAPAACGKMAAAGERLD